VNYIVRSFFQDARGAGQIEVLLLVGFIIVGSVLLVYIYSEISKGTVENVDSFALEAGSWVEESVAEQLGYSEPQNDSGNDSGNENWTCKLDDLVVPGLTSKEATKLRKRGWDCSPD
jgi:Flp pilus assembly pilin Flp